MFNAIPDIYTEKERFNVTFDKFGGGSNFADKEDELYNNEKKKDFVKEVKLDLDFTPK